MDEGEGGTDCQQGNLAKGEILLCMAVQCLQLSLSS